MAVNTTVGKNVLALCSDNYPPTLLAMLRVQEKGTTVHGILLQAPMTVRLVPEYRHEMLLSSSEDSLHHAQMFASRLNDFIGAEPVKLVPTKDADQQIIVLRAVVMSGPNRASTGGL